MIRACTLAPAFAAGAATPPAAEEMTGAGTITFVGFHIGDRPVAGSQNRRRTAVIGGTPDGRTDGFASNVLAFR